MRYVVKIGGSAFDLGAKIVIPLCKSLDTLSDKHEIFITAGGGILLDTMKDMKDDYNVPDKIYNEISWDLIATNIRVLNLHIKKNKVSMIDKSPYINGSESDVHTIKLAESLDIKTVFFMKDTKGIFDKDPNQYKKTIFYKEIKAKDVKNKICRIGTDKRGGHLIEDKAIDVFQESKIVKEIVVLDCKDTLSLHKFLSGIDIGSKIKK